jgi:hypothetical protein
MKLSDVKMPNEMEPYWTHAAPSRSPNIGPREWLPGYQQTNLTWKKILMRYQINRIRKIHCDKGKCIFRSEHAIVFTNIGNSRL